MVDHGATHILAISRRGISSSKAQQLCDFIRDSGNTLQVFKADACDRKAMSQILRDVRAKAPIKGTVNMAMVLGDAAMATMTGN